MAYTVSLTPAAPSGVIGTSTNLKATTAGAAQQGTETFVWTVDGQKQDSVTSALKFMFEAPAGQKTIKVVATNTPSEGDPETAEATAKVTVKNGEITATVKLDPASITVERDQPAKFTAMISNEPEGASKKFTWKKDGVKINGATSDVYNIDTASVDDFTITVDVEISAPNYDTKTITAQGKVTINERQAVVPEGELPYVHPLPWRNSAYIWCGWWVMDELQKMVDEDKNWKIDDPDSKYYKYRYTLAKMLEDYDEVDVQESRNGRILHRDAIEYGIIYH